MNFLVSSCAQKHLPSEKTINMLIKTTNNDFVLIKLEKIRGNPWVKSPGCTLAMITSAGVHWVWFVFCACETLLAGWWPQHRGNGRHHCGVHCWSGGNSFDCICMYVYMHVYMSIHTCICIYGILMRHDVQHVCMYVCMYVCICECIRIRTRFCYVVWVMYFWYVSIM